MHTCACACCPPHMYVCQLSSPRAGSFAAALHATACAGPRGGRRLLAGAGAARRRCAGCLPAVNSLSRQRPYAVSLRACALPCTPHVHALPCPCVCDQPCAPVAQPRPHASRSGAAPVPCAPAAMACVADGSNAPLHGRSRGPHGGREGAAGGGRQQGGRNNGGLTRSAPLRPLPPHVTRTAAGRMAAAHGPRPNECRRHCGPRVGRGGERSCAAAATLSAPLRILPCPCLQGRVVVYV